MYGVGLKYKKEEDRGEKWKGWTSGMVSELLQEM